MPPDDVPPFFTVQRDLCDRRSNGLMKLMDRPGRARPTRGKRLRRLFSCFFRFRGISPNAGLLEKGWLKRRPKGHIIECYGDRPEPRAPGYDKPFRGQFA